MNKIILVLVLSIGALFAGKDISDLEAGCDMNVADDCLEAGVYYNHKHELPEKQMELLKKACDLGNGMGCLNAANAMQDDESKLNYTMKGCDLKHGLSCTMLGFIYQNGNSATPKDPKKAKFYFKKACELGDKVTCGYLK
jgi:hypothetical protein